LRSAKPVEHWERHNEINAVECRAKRVHQAAIFEGVAWKAANGKSLHVCCSIGHQTHNSRSEHGALPATGICCLDLAEDDVGQGVVEAEVEVCGKEHRDGDAVEIPARKRISCLQDGIKVVGVPIVSYEAEDSNPKIRLEGISFKKRNVRIFRNPRRHERLE